MSDSDEEEIIVYACFEQGTVEKEMFQLPNLHWKVIGLDSETPIVQLGDTTFKGEWDDTIGTKLLFEEDPSPEQVDQAVSVIPPVMLKYKCQTSKALNLSRIFLKPKNPEDEVNNKAHEGVESELTPEIDKMDINAGHSESNDQNGDVNMNEQISSEAQEKEA